MKKRLFVSVLVLAILLCGVVAYAKVTTTPNGYTIDFTYDSTVHRRARCMARIARRMLR